MYTFYPRDIEMWRDQFEFNPPITLTPPAKPSALSFHTKQELIEFLKNNGVKLDDLQYPLQFIGPEDNDRLGPDTYSIVQWSLVGWMKNNYRS